MFPAVHTPLISSAAATRLPRWALLTLVVLYAIPGLFGRDPWRTQDAAGFGLAHTLATQGWPTPWTMASYGEAVAAEGPFMFWLAAACIRVLYWLPADEAARIATLLVLLASLAAIWYGAFRLALAPSARPVDPMGVAPEVVDWARAYADSALLLTLACLGLVARMHETTAEVGLVLASSLAVLGSAWATWRPWLAGLVYGTGIAAALLSRGLAPAGMLVVAMGLLCLSSPAHRFVANRWILGSMVVGLALAGPWLALALMNDPSWMVQWMAWHQEEYQVWPTWRNLEGMLRILPWYAWPAWPFALWGLWVNRQRWRSLPHVVTPLVLSAAAGLLALLVRPATDEPWLMVLPPLAVLGVAGLVTLRRSMASFVDWFAVIVFTVACAVIWLYWLAHMTGVPARLAARIPILYPEPLPTAFHPLEVLAGFAVTVAWIFTIFWRVRRGRPRLWRPVVLSASGLVLAWSLLMTLWLPAGDAAKGYAQVASQLQSALRGQPPDCVRTEGLGLAQRASFAWLAELPLQSEHAAKGCRLLLIQDSPGRGMRRKEPQGWLKVWEGRRSFDRNERERFRLFRQP